MIFNSTSNPDIETVIKSAINNALSNTHTNLIAKITKVNAKTIDCKPVIARIVDGKKYEMPTFIEVPVVNFLGGGSSIQMPLSVGDYCVLFVSERCFDNWYDGKDFEIPLELRKHDYSDAVALTGLKNRSGELDIPTKIKMVGDAEQIGDYTHTGNRNQTGENVVTGKIESQTDIVTPKVSCSGNVAGASFSIGASAGATGTFTSADGKTITVSGGIITAIV